MSMNKKKLIARPSTRRKAAQRCAEHVLDIKMGRSGATEIFRGLTNLKIKDYCEQEIERQQQINNLQDDDTQSE